MTARGFIEAMHLRAPRFVRCSFVACACIAVLGAGCASREAPHPSVVESVSPSDAGSSDDALDASVLDAASDAVDEAKTSLPLEDGGAPDAASGPNVPLSTALATYPLVTLIPAAKPGSFADPPRSERGMIAPTTFEGELRASAGYPDGVIRRVVRQRFGTLATAFGAELQRTPSARPRVVARFVINRRGDVAYVDVTSPTASKAMLDAVKTIVANMQFPASDVTWIVVEATFHFGMRVVDSRGVLR